MASIDITDSNATVGSYISSLFIQSCWILQFAQACSLINPSYFSVRNMRNSQPCLHYWLVSLLELIGLNNVLTCSFLTSANTASNYLSPKLLIPFFKLYVWENIWPRTVISSVVYSIVSSFVSTVCFIKYWYDTSSLTLWVPIYELVPQFM